MADHRDDVAPIDWDTLHAAACTMAGRAYAPYSNFPVGAAGITSTQAMVTGCNVENASYGMTLCAECGLVSDLHRQGGGELVAVCIVDGEGAHLAPCGRCRQLLYEAGGSGLLIHDDVAPRQLAELLPDPFGPGHLRKPTQENP
jgi:cytidine deaminase